MPLQNLEYPLRQPHDVRKFLIWLVFLPAAVVTLLTLFFANLLFSPLPGHSIFISLVHFLALIIFLWLYWLPIELAIHNFPHPLWDWFEGIVILLRTIALVAAVRFLFPHNLILEFLDERQTHTLIAVGYEVAFFALLVFYTLFSFMNNSRKAFGDVRRATAPESRSRMTRWLWFDAFSVFFVLFAVIVIELYFMATLSLGAFSDDPYSQFKMASRKKYAQAAAGKILIKAQQSGLIQVGSDSTAPFFAPETLLLELRVPRRDWEALTHAGLDSSAVALDSLKVTVTPSSRAQALMILKQAEEEKEEKTRDAMMIELAWLCCGILSGLVFFLGACLPNRLMHATLIPVTFHERDMRGIIFKAYRYFFHFARAMLLKNPILILGGLIITGLFLTTPAVLTGAQRFYHLDVITQADEIILVLVVFLSWFIPLAIAVVTPDDTFGEYFNHRLADHLMMIQGHLVFVGHGDLGKRVLDREIDRFRMLEHEKLMPKKKEAFFEIVTPDLRLEKICDCAVVVEHDLKDVVYSSNHPLLGDYGVVAAARKIYSSQDARGNTIHPEKRLLVPILRGEAREPFISSRVNLERASLVISMVPDEGSVQAVFERANKANVSSIICVSRSDQISYLTYRSRHRPIVLVYPKENQGVTLGERLWAAIQKVRAVRKLSQEQWPKVMVIGNNKANHYMLERLWTYLPVTHVQRNNIVRKNFRFIVTDDQTTQAHPILKPLGTSHAFDESFPATYISSGRFPYPTDQDFSNDVIHAITRAVNTADIRALEACLAEHQPDILMINHEDVERSLLMLSRCMRAMERIKTSMPGQFRLPLLLLAAARGDDWERRSLGDASRYYDALCRLHREELAVDMSYPVHAYYDHLQNEQIGESIVDSLADVEEIIAGARTTLQDPLKPPPKEEDIGFPDQPAKSKFIEVNSCLPNRAGALADYLAALSGMKFYSHDAKEIQKHWEASSGVTSDAIVAPSFQYLRNITLDPQRQGLALSGYANLSPLPPKFDAAAAQSHLAVRAFANDGRRYVESELDPDIADTLVNPTRAAEDLSKFRKPLAPGVPEVLERITGLAAEAHNTVGDFHKVLLDPQQPDQTTGKHACPGMSICRIAALQDYVVASNSLRLHRLMQSPGDAALHNDRLWHAKNYACCAQALPSAAEETPQHDTHAARIFCCCNGEDQPGLIARVLNTLLFRATFERELPVGDDEKDWVVNIDYFKGISCQNPNFSLIRLFGFFQQKREYKDFTPGIPFQLLRILPIGGLESARQWYYYCRTLHAFLNANATGRQFKFNWVDENRVVLPLHIAPSFKKDEPHCPVALIIKAEDRKLSPAEKEGRCELCWEQPSDYDCRKLRVWV